MTKTDLKNHCLQVFSFFQIQWKKWKPEIDKFLRAITAILTVASTFKFALQTFPVIVSILTVLATLPLVNYLFPSVFFTTSLNSTLIFSVIGVISSYVGYSKYKELILRNELDMQTVQHKQDIQELAEKNASLEKRLEKLEQLFQSRPHYLPSAALSSNDELTTSIKNNHVENGVNEAHEEPLYKTLSS